MCSLSPLPFSWVQLHPFVPDPSTCPPSMGSSACRYLLQCELPRGAPSGESVPGHWLHLLLPPAAHRAGPLSLRAFGPFFSSSHRGTYGCPDRPSCVMPCPGAVGTGCAQHWAAPASTHRDLMALLPAPGHLDQIHLVII